MLSVGYKARDKKKSSEGEGWGAHSRRREGHPEGRETSDSREQLQHMGPIPYSFTSSALSGFRVVSASC